MAKISVYTMTTDAIKNEYFTVEGIKSALVFADEVVVLDGGSSDNTIEQIKNIGDSRVKIYTNKWLHSLGKGMYAIQKSLALGYCTGDWCVLMDSDEVYHEKDSEAIKRLPDVVADSVDCIIFNTLHFYKDYRHLLNGCPDWKDLYTEKVYMVRNGLNIHHGAVGYDPDNHVDNDGQPIPDDKKILVQVCSYHYGHVRSPEYYVAKYNRIERAFHGDKHIDKTIEDFEWVPEYKLTNFKGTHPAVMKNRIDTGTNHSKILELYNYCEGDADGNEGV